MGFPRPGCERSGVWAEVRSPQERRLMWRRGAGWPRPPRLLAPFPPSPNTGGNRYSAAGAEEGTEKSPCWLWIGGSARRTHRLPHPHEVRSKHISSGF